MKYAAKFFRDGRRTYVAITERSYAPTLVRSRCMADMFVHERSAYTMTEAAQTAEWLNERAAGYPANGKLDHLRNGRA